VGVKYTGVEKYCDWGRKLLSRKR